MTAGMSPAVSRLACPLVALGAAEEGESAGFGAGAGADAGDGAGASGDGDPSGVASPGKFPQAKLRRVRLVEA